MSTKRPENLKKSMEFRHSRFQARSLIISITGHAAILALCIQLSRSIGNAIPQPSGEERKGMPAKVSVQEAAPWHGTSPSEAASQTSNLQSIADQPNKIPPSAPKPSTVRKQQKRHTARPSNLPDVENAASALPNSHTHARPSPAHEKSSGNSDSYSSGSYGNTAVADARQNEGGPEGSSRGGKISGAAFMGAFRRSMYNDKAARSSSATSRGGSGSGTGSGSMPEHVQDRLNEWQWSHYHEKVWKALVKACRIHRKYVRAPVDMQTKINVTLILDKKGKVKNILDIEKVGIDDIDDFIREFFLAADFPEIPKRLPEEEVSKRITISLHMVEGGHYLQLVPMHE